MWDEYWLAPSFSAHLKLIRGVVLFWRNQPFNVWLLPLYISGYQLLCCFFSFCQVLSLPAAQAPRGRCPATTHLCRARPWPPAWQLVLLAVCPIRRMGWGARSLPAVPATSCFHLKLQLVSHLEASFLIHTQVSPPLFCWGRILLKLCSSVW